jgi:hypothetical protein
MELLTKMKMDLNNLWGQAITSKDFEKRTELIEQYKSSYRKYKKQIRFLEAMVDQYISTKDLKKT